MIIELVSAPSSEGQTGPPTPAQLTWQLSCCKATDTSSIAETLAVVDALPHLKVTFTLV
jgi:hypothetical protein